MSTEPIRLDRKRSYGTVFNDPNIGFVQDERNFRADGTLYVPLEQKADIGKFPSAADFPASSELISAVNKLTQKLETEAPRRDTLTRTGVQSGK